MHEAPEIDGVVHVPDDLRVGSLVDVTITGAEGPTSPPPPTTGPRSRAGVGAGDAGT